jgi:pimeloyl-ACP methyl ester carboxylesterase
MLYSNFKKDISAARKRISLLEIKIADTKKGKIEYTTFGEGLPVLWIHGIVGGADQGAISSKPLTDEGFKIIAVSRFGYMGSPLPKDPTPASQADLYAALLDHLNISKVSIVGFSAGGPSALQFALKHPNRCLSLILLSGAMPPYKVPSGIVRFFAKKFFGSDFIFWCLTKYFTGLMRSIMGVPKSIQKNLTDADKKWLDDSMFSFLPVSLRTNGIINDIWVTNPDLNKDYPYKQLKVPTLIIHAVDDPMPPFTTAKRIAGQIPNSTFVKIGSGGHLHIGHHSIIRSSISGFITNTQKTMNSLTTNEQQSARSFI